MSEHKKQEVTGARRRLHSRTFIRLIILMMEWDGIGRKLNAHKVN